MKDIPAVLNMLDKEHSLGVLHKVLLQSINEEQKAPKGMYRLSKLVLLHCHIWEILEEHSPKWWTKKKVRERERDRERVRERKWEWLREREGEAEG